jgi:putative hydrolase of HD superfamily
MALLFSNGTDAPEIDMARVLTMLLVHDVVEVDAGDTFCYDAEATEHQEQREHQAAVRLFGLLPEDQANDLKGAWLEFEEQSTPESQLANALDRLQPLLMNCSTEGHSWRENGVGREQVLQRMMPIRRALPRLWSRVEERLDNAVDRGWLLP